MTNKISPQDMAEQAKRAYQCGDYLEAAHTFGEAAAAYLNLGDLHKAAEMKNNQSVALLLSGKAQAALEAVEGTQQIFADSSDFRHLGMALANHASALEALKRMTEAIEYYKRAGVALEEAKEGDMRANVMQKLGMLYLRHFKLYDAVIALQSGLAGSRNPTTKQRLIKKILFVRL
jgi:tetratricopeptide (TPR) repeat protein